MPIPATLFRRMTLATACTATLLAGCGGNSVDEAVPAQRTLTAVALSEADHQASVQRLYNAYLGRAADPAGMDYFTGVSRQLGLPGDTGALYYRYGVEPGVRQLLDSLAASAEASALYSGDNRTAVTAMYRNLFNRDPDPGGLVYWSDVISSGALTRGQVPVALLAGAHMRDLAIFDRKAQVASAFTAALNTPQRVASYDGDADVAALRLVLAKVSAGTTADEERALVEEALAVVAATPRQAGAGPQ